MPAAFPTRRPLACAPAWVLVLGLGLGLTAPSWAGAAPVITAAQAAKSQVSTLAPCPSYCGGTGGRAQFIEDGGVGVAASFASLANQDGNGRAQATLDGPTDLPVLRAEAFASTGAIGGSLVGAGASGMQGFFVGAGGLATYQLAIGLTGTTTDTVQATVAVFRDRAPQSAPGFSNDPATMVYEVLALSPDLELHDWTTLHLPATGSLQTVTGQLSTANLPEGALFYVWASLETRGLRGTSGEAFDTLTLGFDDARGLSHTGVVPEPATAATLLAGLGLLGWRLRRRPTAIGAMRGLSAAA